MRNRFACQEGVFLQSLWGGKQKGRFAPALLDALCRPKEAFN